MATEDAASLEGYTAEDTPEAEDAEATEGQTPEGATELPDLDDLTDEQYDEWVQTLPISDAEKKRLAKVKPVRGTKAFSRSQNALHQEKESLALVREDYARAIEQLVGQTVPEAAPAAAPRSEEQGLYIDPAVVELQQKIARLEAAQQQESVAKGVGLIAEQMAALAKEYPFFASKGVSGGTELWNFMAQNRIGDARLAFRNLYFEDIIRQETSKVAEELRQERVTKTPPLSPKGSASRAPAERPKGKEAITEAAHRANVGERFMAAFGIKSQD